jgi:hypothetical protein
MNKLTAIVPVFENSYYDYSVELHLAVDKNGKLAHSYVGLRKGKHEAQYDTIEEATKYVFGLNNPK